VRIFTFGLMFSPYETKNIRPAKAGKHWLGRAMDMHERREFGLRSAGLMIALLALCLLAMGAAVVLRPARFTSHQEEITYVLLQRGVAATQVKLSQSSIDTQNFYAYTAYSIYGADVIVNLADGRVILGRIGCRVKRSSCYLSLGKLGIINQALPDLAADELTAWLNWLDRNLPRFG
jgi:hypothetical protein